MRRKLCGELESFVIKNKPPIEFYLDEKFTQKATAQDFRERKAFSVGYVFDNFKSTSKYAYYKPYTGFNPYSGVDYSNVDLPPAVKVPYDKPVVEMFDNAFLSNYSSKSGSVLMYQDEANKQIKKFLNENNVDIIMSNAQSKVVSVCVDGIE